MMKKRVGPYFSAAAWLLFSVFVGLLAWYRLYENPRTCEYLAIFCDDGSVGVHLVFLIIGFSILFMGCVDLAGVTVFSFSKINNELLTRARVAVCQTMLGMLIILVSLIIVTSSV